MRGNQAFYKENIGKKKLKVFFKQLANLPKGFDRANSYFHLSVID